MYDYRGWFFSRIRAEQFCDNVAGELSIWRDGFGQTIYVVCYN